MSDQKQIDPTATYTVGRAATLLGCGRWSVRERIRDKTLVATKLLNSRGRGWWRIAGDELLRLKGQMVLASQPAAPASTRTAQKSLKDALDDLGFGSQTKARG